MHLFGVHLFCNPNNYNTTRNIERNSSHEPSLGDGVTMTNATATSSITPRHPSPTTPISASTPNTTTWRNSKEKYQITNKPKGPLSNIHLTNWRYTKKCFSNANFGQTLQDYAGTNFNLNNFKVKLKLQLVHSLKKTGAFKAETTLPWYTSANKVSRPY
jgi:hypothetical protein